MFYSEAAFSEAVRVPPKHRPQAEKNELRTAETPQDTAPVWRVKDVLRFRQASTRMQSTAAARNGSTRTHLKGVRHSSQTERRKKSGGEAAAKRTTQ